MLSARPRCLSWGDPMRSRVAAVVGLVIAAGVLAGVGTARAEGDPAKAGKQIQKAINARNAALVIKQQASGRIGLAAKAWNDQSAIYDGDPGENNGWKDEPWRDPEDLAHVDGLREAALGFSIDADNQFGQGVQNDTACGNGLTLAGYAMQSQLYTAAYNYALGAEGFATAAGLNWNTAKARADDSEAKSIAALNYMIANP